MIWKVETHCHSQFSSDSMSKPEDLVKTARKRGLNKLVLTDHNTIRGALAAQKLDPELIIVGEEILTTEGEFLAFFVQEEIPRGLPPMQALARLKEQNAFISVSHPFDYLRKGWSKETLIKMLPDIDAIEIFNARSFTKGINQQAQEFAQEHGLAGTAGSDAHLLLEVGRTYLKTLPFENADQLRVVIRESDYFGFYSSPLVRFGSTFAKMIKPFQKKK